MSVRRLAAVVLVLSLGLLVLAAAGHGQLPPSGLSKPDFEGAKSDLQLGQELFAANCASCHGTDGRGVYGPAQPGAGNVKGLGPSLRGVGALAADFYLRMGYMPLARPTDQPVRRRPQFGEREIRAMVAYVASLGDGPAIPTPHPEQGSVAAGLHAFTEHCAGCHQVVGQGGVVTGARVPPLEDATPRQIAQAVRIGPYVMPKFSEKQITPAELDSIIAYVQTTKDPPDRGGWGIGNIGPVPEGAVTWLIALVALVSLCVVIGKKGTRPS